MAGRQSRSAIIEDPDPDSRKEVQEEPYGRGIPGPTFNPEGRGKTLTGLFLNATLTLIIALHAAFTANLPIEQLNKDSTLLQEFLEKLKGVPSDAPYDGKYETIQCEMEKLGYRHCIWTKDRYKRNDATRFIHTDANKKFEDGTVFWVPIGMPPKTVLTYMRPSVVQYICSDGYGIQVENRPYPAVVFVENGGYLVCCEGASYAVYICTNGKLPYECKIKNWKQLTRADIAFVHAGCGIRLDKKLVWEFGFHEDTYTLGIYLTFRGSKCKLAAAPLAAAPLAAAAESDVAELAAATESDVARESDVAPELRAIPFLK